jgi:hypothetical protein
VNHGQYRRLLESLPGGAAVPGLEPAGPGVRGQRGLEGLRKDLWPELRWAIEHRELLARRLDELRGRDLGSSALTRAKEFLPDTVTLKPRLFVVMGGRAGAAALDSGQIYFDVLATSYRESTGALGAYPPAPEVIDFYAHEVHHLGLSAIISRTRGGLHLSPAQNQAFDFLEAIVMEGSASYFVTGHRDLNLMRRDPQFALLDHGDSLLTATQKILTTILDPSYSPSSYDSLVAPMLGMGWHNAGTLLLETIDRAGGFAAVKPVLKDPRLLPTAFNDARRKLGDKGWTFDSPLAARAHGIAR